MSSAAPGRKPNAIEQRIHQAAMADSKKSITPKECETLIPESKVRMDAINFLLATGLLKVMKDAKGGVLFRAVMKKELEVKKDMSGEESMVLSHIQASANEGIWTKHLKAKTELHQTVIDRCLKSLAQKQLIKAVKSVKYPTRKIYMLSHLDPSVEMTGGPWYTDNELDTEFIKLLCSACLRFIRDRSLPKGASAAVPNRAALYPIGAAPAYPTAAQVLGFLRKSRITETTLEVEHVDMLLGVLVLDGEVERLPAFGAAMWDGAMGDGDSEGDARSSSKKRKRKDRDREGAARKRKRPKRSRSDTESAEEDSDAEDSRRVKVKNRADSKGKSRGGTKARSKRRSKDESDESGSASESAEERKPRRKKKRRSSEASENESEDEDRKRTRSKSKTKKRKRRSYSSDEESASDTESSRTASDADSDARPQSKGKAKRSASPAAHDTGGADALEYGAHVYRAVRPEGVGAGGGVAQAPCTRCPTFEFCKPGGPVSPDECVYYGEWLGVTAGGAEREGGGRLVDGDTQGAAKLDL